MQLRIGLTHEGFKLCRGRRDVENDGELYGNHTIALNAARGSYAAFQLVLRTDRDYSLNLGEEPYTPQRGEKPAVRIAATSPLPVRLQHIGGMTDDGGYVYADVLLHQAVLELPGGQAHSVWAEVPVPSETPAGTYAGILTVYTGRTGEECVAAVLRFTLQVVGYVMPSPRENGFFLDLWQHCCNIARQAETPLWSDAHFAVLEGYVASLAALGQKAVTLVVCDMPWCGQSCGDEYRQEANLYEYGIVRVEEAADGSFHCDFSAMQRYIDLCAAHGIDGAIEVFGLINVWAGTGLPAPCPAYGDALRVRYLARDGRYDYMREVKDIDAYIQALEAYFVRQGLIDRVRLAADEPGDAERYRRNLAHIRAIAPRFRLEAAFCHHAFVREFGEGLDTVVPVYSYAFEDYGSLRSFLQEGTKTVLWYVCCGPASPNTFLRSPLEETWLLCTLTAFAGLHGLLRWSYTAWPDHPRQDIRYGSFPAGDLQFVYPAADGTPLLSLRWQALRRGIEYAVLLKAAPEPVSRSVYETLLGETDPVAFFAHAGPCPADWAGDRGAGAFQTAYRRLLLSLGQEQVESEVLHEESTP